MTRSNLNCKMRKRVPYYAWPLKCIQHFYGPPFKSYGCWLLNRVGGRSLVRHFFFSCGCGVLEVSIYHSNYRVNDSDYSVNDSNHPNNSPNDPNHLTNKLLKLKPKPSQCFKTTPFHFGSFIYKLGARKRKRRKNTETIIIHPRHLQHTQTKPQTSKQLARMV